MRNLSMLPKNLSHSVLNQPGKARTRMASALMIAIVLLAWVMPMWARGETQPLRIHPQNPRYFEYNGLPLVLFGHQGVRGIVPVPGSTPPDRLSLVARHGNHFYMAVHPTWVRATYEQTHAALADEANWRQVRAVLEEARRHDVIVHLFFWSYKFNYDRQDWSGSDMLWPDPREDGGEVLPDVTRLDLHELAIRQAVRHTWDLPNAIYNFMWEYNVRRRGGQDPEGDFHRWWARSLRDEGRKAHPGIERLISVKWGWHPPSELGADFIVEEDGNGFFFGHPHTLPLSFGVPCVFISSDFVFADNNFTGWANVPYSPRIWANGQVGDYRITPEDLRAMVTEGFHPAASWDIALPETLDHYLQVRWHLENLRTWHRQTAACISEQALPLPVSSRRPTLTNPDGYVNGRDGSRYAAIYTHPEGLPPAQAELWVDHNGDGRFDTDPDAGERIAMQAQGDDFAGGVLFTATAPGGRRYVFRFADRNWNPPHTGGLVPGHAAGISYRTWE
jgi:hypothetical protein